LETLLTDKILIIASDIQKERENTLAKFKITPGHEKFLLCLAHRDGMTMGAISEAIGMKPPSTAKFAAKLEQQGHIKRKSSPLDSRQQHAHLTDSGKQVAIEFEEEFKKIDKKYKKKLSTKKQDRLKLLLQLLQANKRTKSPAALKPKKAGKSAKEAIKAKEKKAKKKKEQ